MVRDVRKRILNILAEPSTVTSIRTKLKDIESFGTIAYHLKELYDNGVVGKDKDESKRGSPTTYYLLNKDVINKVKKGRENRRKAKYVILKIIKDEPMIEDKELLWYLQRLGLSDVDVDEVMNCVSDSLTTFHHKITTKGLNFLEDNKNVIKRNEKEITKKEL